MLEIHHTYWSCSSFSGAVGPVLAESTFAACDVEGFMFGQCLVETVDSVCTVELVSDSTAPDLRFDWGLANRKLDNSNCSIRPSRISSRLTRSLSSLRSCWFFCPVMIGCVDEVVVAAAAAAVLVDGSDWPDCVGVSRDLKVDFCGRSVSSEGEELFPLTFRPFDSLAEQPRRGRSDRSGVVCKWGWVKKFTLDLYSWHT